ncbi:NPC intracellular cholesterol transporter 2-like [Epargyreus clarus]|uniref:NPC intracellular cholesterol transporter 2-like n=1 Tax=Epargyreus clarus TaxID=520877 RepID=UPI003C2EFD68
MKPTQLLTVVFAFSIIAVVYCKTYVTPSEQCSGGDFDNLRERIQVIPCGKTKCKLQRGTNTTVIFKFRPKYEVRSLTNKVYANIAGIPLPFIGVNEVSACPQVTRADTGERAACPLAPDQEYTYTNVFFIESFYPTVDLRVHWGLYDGKRDVICFEVPATITPAKKQ